MTPFEENVYDLTRRLLDEYRAILNDLELRADLRGIKVLDDSPTGRSSELEVVFYRGTNIADIFEFFVEKDGEPNATIAEVEDWLRTELADLPERHA